MPTILVAQNKTHKSIIEGWVKKKCALKAENSIPSILNTLNHIHKNNGIINILKTNGLQLVDGLGAERIAKKITGIKS